MVLGLRELAENAERLGNQRMDLGITVVFLEQARAVDDGVAVPLLPEEVDGDEAQDVLRGPFRTDGALQQLGADLELFRGLLLLVEREQGERLLQVQERILGRHLGRRIEMDERQVCLAELSEDRGKIEVGKDALPALLKHLVEEPRRIDELPAMEEADGENESRVEIADLEALVVGVQLECPGEAPDGLVRPPGLQPCETEEPEPRGELRAGLGGLQKVTDGRGVGLERQVCAAEEEVPRDRIRFLLDEEVEGLRGPVVLSEGMVGAAEVEECLRETVRASNEPKQDIDGAGVVVAPASLDCFVEKSGIILRTTTPHEVYHY